MPDLSALAAELLAHPVSRTPPIEHVVARARRYRRRRRGAAAAVALGLVVTAVAVGRNSSWRR